MAISEGTEDTEAENTGSMGRHLASTNSSAVKFCTNHSGKPSMALADGNYRSEHR